MSFTALWFIGSVDLGIFPGYDFSVPRGPLLLWEKPFSKYVENLNKYHSAMEGTKDNEGAARGVLSEKTDRLTQFEFIVELNVQP